MVVSGLGSLISRSSFRKQAAVRSPFPRHFPSVWHNLCSFFRVTDEFFSCTELQFHINAKGKGPARLINTSLWKRVGSADTALLKPSALDRIVSFTPQTLYPLGESPDTHGVGGWVGPTAGLEAMKARKISALIGYGTPIHGSSRL
jgi:hypothetical protein